MSYKGSISFALTFRLLLRWLKRRLNILLKRFFLGGSVTFYQDVLGVRDLQMFEKR